jgi:hypothetical protein
MRSRSHNEEIARQAYADERVARQRLRRELSAIRRLHHRADVDVTPLRHRQNAHWLA